MLNRNSSQPSETAQLLNMNSAIQQRWKILCVAICALCLAGAAWGQTLPDGKGKAELIHGCTDCHGTDLIVQKRRSPADWEKEVNDMAARGSESTPEDIANIIHYLSTNFGLKKAGTTATAPSATPPTSEAAALSPSEIESARRTITQNGCLACHRVGTEGAYTGPSLNGLASRDSADQIRAAILSPNPRLSSANTLARFTTSDGKTTVGRILSQNDQDVRVISSSGEVASYSRSSLRQFTIIETNPMPSYGGKITGQDLNTLVRYLGSLPSVDESAQK